MTAETTEQLAARFGPAYKWYVTFTVMIGTVNSILSSTMINVALPDIMGEFGLGQDQVQWLSTAFLASVTATMLVTTWAVARVGARQAYMMSTALFALGCVLGGMSPDENGVILARTIQGAAAGLVQPLAMVIIFQAFPANRRGSAMGVFGIGVILAPALGPTLGGLMVDNYSWRYVFFVGLPLCGLGMLLAPIFLPSRMPAPKHPFDWLGFALLTAGIGAFLTGLANGQRMGWDSDLVDGAFLLAGLCTIGFVVQELHTATPVLALDVFSNPRFFAASAVAFILGLGVFGSTYLVPFFVQTVQGYMPTDSGLLLMPAGLVLGVVFPLAGRLSDSVAPHRLILAGLVIFSASNLLMSNADTSTEFWLFAGWVAVGRVGMGLIMPALNSGALRVLEPRLVSHGAGAINFMRQLGGAVGVDLLSVYLERQTTFYASEMNSMQTGSHAAADTLDVIAFFLNRAGLHENVAVALRADEAYRFLSRMISSQAAVLGFRESFLFVAVIFLGAVVPAWFMRPAGKRR